jgi:hypothetical protein
MRAPLVLLVLAASLAPGPDAAAARTEPCLSGSFALPDGRALDAVVAQMEALCPCAVFGDVGGNAARAYKRCTREVVRGALASGALRRACRAIVGRSTCGRPDRVVCCEARASAHRCTVRRTARCADTKRWLRTVEGGSACAASVCLRGPTTTTTTLADTTTTTSTSTTSTTLPWSELYSLYLAPTCPTCHGEDAEGGLGDFGTCQGAYDALAGVPSTEFPAWDRIEPGAPERSWLIHKLDGTQGLFDDQCVGGTCGAPMPLELPQLPPEARDAIRVWIAGGAAPGCVVPAAAPR